MPGSEGRLLELDALRGFAALGVIASHLYPAQLFWMGTFVYLFFVLSGFLITRMLLASTAPAMTTLKHFWARRIIRIWPVYYLTLFGVMGITALLVASGIVHYGSSRGLVSALFFVQFIDYHWNPGAPFPPEFVTSFAHSWTLAVEEQFYVLWPLLTVALLRRPLALGALCGATVLVAISARGTGIPGFVLLGVMDAFAIGALVAVLDRTGRLPNWRTQTLSPWVWAMVAAALLVSLLPISRYVNPAYVQSRLDHLCMITAFALAYGSMVLLAVHLAGHRLLAPLRHPVVVYSGTISYAVYMFHIPIIGLFEIALLRYSVARSLLVDTTIWGTILAAASASWFLLEKPFSRLKHRFPL